MRLSVPNLSLYHSFDADADADAGAADGAAVAIAGVGAVGDDGVGGGNAQELHHREQSARMNEDIGTPGSQRFSRIDLIVFNAAWSLRLVQTVRIRVRLM